METFTKIMIDAGIFINNFFVRMFRDLGEFLQDTIGSDFGFSKFGKLLDKEDFYPKEEQDADEENTDAVRENTKAVRDLAREFRNLPQGYRVNRALYESETPQRPLTGILLPTRVGVPNPVSFLRGRL